MKSKDLLHALNDIDEDLIAEAEKQSKRRMPVWIAVSAAVICLLAGALILLPMLKKQPTSTSELPSLEKPSPSVSTDKMAYEPIFEEHSGSALKFVVGNSAEIPEGGSSEPPSFEFSLYGYIVKAAAIKSYPDTYHCLDDLDASPDKEPTSYRLIEFETLEVIRGEGIPDRFLYLLPAYLFVDMTAYDSLLLTMGQLGTEQYVLRNDTQSSMEALEYPVFWDGPDNLPQLGSIIAFSEGVFDESLWKTESWRFGYQFAANQLDLEDSTLIVYRGCSEEEALIKLRDRIKKQNVSKGGRVVSLEYFSSKTAKEALAYVKPFENGVFVQAMRWVYENGKNTRKLVFTRFVNGCQTEETVTIDLDSEEVLYSEIRYSKEEIRQMENLSLRIERLAQAYAEKLPDPPRFTPESGKLSCLNLYGWYVKKDGKIYGIVKTVWLYRVNMGDLGSTDTLYYYYDDLYTVYDASSATMQNLSRDTMLEQFGKRNVYQGKYGIVERSLW